MADKIITFGEKHQDNLWGANLPVERTPKYEKARDAAIKAMKDFNLTEDDFWIKKEIGPFKDKILYTNLILSHSACIKINQMQPEEKRFLPSCVEELKGTPDGGVAFIYRSDKQGLIKTGEAMPHNVGCSYPYAVAEKRLFDRVVTALAGLYEDGIYGEEESGNFRKPEKEAEPLQAASAPSKAVTPTADPRPDILNETPTRAERIAKLKEGIAFTGTDEKVLCDYYSVFSVDELNDDMLSHCESIINPRVKQKLVEQKKLQPASQIKPPESIPEVSSQTPEGISPVAAMLVAASSEYEQTAEEMSVSETEAAQEPEEEDLGQTVYSCSKDAPESFLALNGQTFDQIGKDILKGLYGRKNAAGRRHVDADMLGKIEAYISAA